jgi:hypothetical protein
MAEAGFLVKRITQPASHVIEKARTSGKTSPADPGPNLSWKKRDENGKAKVRLAKNPL